jgi:hypothetical protein
VRVADYGVRSLWWLILGERARAERCTAYTDVSAVLAACEDMAAWLLLLELWQVGALNGGSVAAELRCRVHSCDIMILERDACRMKGLCSVQGQRLHSIAHAVYYSVIHGTGIVVCFIRAGCGNVL